MSCGNSSSEVLRKMRPTRVTRGNRLRVTCRDAFTSAAAVMQGTEFPDLDHFIVEAMAPLFEEDGAGAVELHEDRDYSPNRGARAIRSSAPTTRSNALLRTTSQSAIGLSNTSSTGTLPT